MTTTQWPITDKIELSPPHPPKEASIKAFEEILPSLKHDLIKLRHDLDKHEPAYFRAIASLPSPTLNTLNASSLETVRVAETAYGIHIIGAVKIPETDDAYIHVRIFVKAKEGTDGKRVEDREARLHSIHTEDVVGEDGQRVFRAVFGGADELVWFET